MDRYVKKYDAPFVNNVADALNKAILAGTGLEDLQEATNFVEDLLANPGTNLPPSGLTAPILSVEEY